jgi:hypothetical protein
MPIYRDECERGAKVILADLGVAGATGLLLGQWFRIPALLVSSGANAAVYFSAAPLTELEPMALVIVAYV